MDYEVVKDRLYLRVVSGSAVNARLPQGDGEHCFVVEDLLVYLPFFLDYGPLSLGCLFKFCQMVNNKLTDRQLFDKRVILCCSPKVAARHNAVYLLAAHSLLCLGRSPEEAIRPFARMSPPLAPWHDASPMVDTFHLSTLDVLRGIAKAVTYKFFDMDAFDVAEYEHYERVEAGDMNWLVQGRFLAFAGPHDSRTSPSEGYMTTTVEDVLPYFKSKGVSAVVRLNKKYYNERRFVAVGIAHHDMYYLDGSNPPEHILQRFLATAEATPGAIAVHCKAGLGRTGSCIGAYLMKHYRLTAREVIGWMRVCRPGSVIGPQQHYLEDVQARMWEEGDAFRASRMLPQPAPGSPLAVYTGVGEQGRQSSGESGSNKDPRREDKTPLAQGYSSPSGHVGISTLPTSPTAAAAARAMGRTNAGDASYPSLHRPLASPSTSPIAMAGNGALQRRVGSGGATLLGGAHFRTEMVGGGLPAPGGSLSGGYDKFTAAAATYAPVNYGAGAGGRGYGAALGSTVGLARPTGLSSPTGLSGMSGMTGALRTLTSGNSYAAGMLLPIASPSRAAAAQNPGSAILGPGQGELLRSAKSRNSPVSPQVGVRSLAPPVGVPSYRSLTTSSSRR